MENTTKTKNTAEHNPLNPPTSEDLSETFQNP